MKATKAERQLIALEKGLRDIRKTLSTMIREISPKSRHAVKDLKVTADRKATDSEITNEDVVEALGSFSIKRGDSGWHAYPPDDKIHPTTWNRIRWVMSNNGGDWSASRKAFVFEIDPTPLFKGLTQGKIVNRKKDRQAFYTPPSVAEQVVALADVKGKIVLEPSAGEGALADACLDAGADSVECNDIDEHAVEVLLEKGHHADLLDFLAVPAPYRYYDRVVMNPPFAKKAFIKHILHALKFLKPGGRLVSVIPGYTMPKELVKALSVGSTWHCIPLGQGAFKTSGTAVKTSILVINLAG